MSVIRNSLTVAVLILCLSSRAEITNSPSYFTQGVTAMTNREWDKAIKDFSEVLTMNQTNVPALNYRGCAYFMKGDLDRAISDFDQALLLNPTDIDAALNLPNAYRAKGEFEKSIPFWDKYMRLNPTNDYAYKSRATAYNAIGKYDEAIKDWNEGLRLNPNDSFAMTLRASAYFKTSQFDKAEHDFIEAVRINPTNDASLNGFAWFRATCPVASFRNGKEAVEAATKACQLTNWTRLEWVDTLAAAFAEAGDFEKAVLYEKQAMGMNGASENTRMNMQHCLSLYESKQPNHEGEKM